MADFPRWIPAYNVDSVAMYSAYQECLVVSPGISRYLGFKGHLTFIEHDAERLGNPAGAPQMDVRIAPVPEKGAVRDACRAEEVTPSDGTLHCGTPAIADMPGLVHGCPAWTNRPITQTRCGTHATLRPGG